MNDMIVHVLPKLNCCVCGIAVLVAMVAPPQGLVCTAGVEVVQWLQVASVDLSHSASDGQTVEGSLYCIIIGLP